MLFCCRNIKCTECHVESDTTVLVRKLLWWWREFSILIYIYANTGLSLVTGLCVMTESKGKLRQCICENNTRQSHHLLKLWWLTYFEHFVDNIWKKNVRDVEHMGTVLCVHWIWLTKLFVRIQALQCFYVEWLIIGMSNDNGIIDYRNRFSFSFSYYRFSKSVRVH